VSDRSWATRSVREQGIPLYGPDPKTLTDPISPDELRAAIRERMSDWTDWANQPEELPGNGSARTMPTSLRPCAAHYTLATGTLPSKPQAHA
jgi:hypothetical protein